MGNKQKITALLQDTLLPSVHIDVVQEDTSCLESKFGGIFYLHSKSGTFIRKDSEAGRRHYVLFPAAVRPL